MNMLLTFLFSLLLLAAVSLVVAGTFLSERWSKTSGRAFLAVGGLLAAASLAGGLYSSGIIDIPVNLLGVLIGGAVIVLAAGTAISVSAAKGDIPALAVSVAILMIAGTIIGVNSVAVAETIKKQDIAEACERSGTGSDICKRFAEKYGSRTRANVVFSRYDGSPQEARLMLTGSPISKEDCIALINEHDVSTRSLRNALRQKTFEIVASANVNNWCEAAAYATKNNTSIQRVQKREDSMICQKEPSTKLLTCWSSFDSKGGS